MTQNAAKESLLVRSLAIIFVASFALLPMLMFGCSPEWARWDASQANAFFKRGETYEALYQLEDAVRKSPRDAVIKLSLAERLIDLKKPEESLTLCDEVLEIYPDNIHAMQIKSQAQLRKGDFEAALATELEIDEWLQAYRRDTSRLNAIAYARVLADKDLPLAKEGIETAIAALNRGIGWPGEFQLHFHIKATVLASLVSRSCDRRDESLNVLSSEIDFYRKTTNALRGELTGYVYEQTEKSFPLREDKSTRDHRGDLRSVEAQLATLLSCRALLLQDLGESERCRADRLEVRELGYQSSQVVSGFPDDKTAMLSLGRFGLGGVLDTRGFVCGRLPWREQGQQVPEEQRKYLSSHGDALRDMDVAILCNRVNQASFNCSLRNIMELELSFNRDREIRQLKKEEAVLCYHRMLVHQRHGDQDLAAVDEDRIRELGEEPGPQLF